jgi:hypothetical protein
MTKKFQAAKASFVTGLVLVSIIVAVIPTTSAGILYNLQSVLTVSWSANDTKTPVVPRGALRTLELTINHHVTRGVFGQVLLQLYAGYPVVIHIEIVKTPTWVTATLAQGTLTVTVTPDIAGSTVTTQISLQVADDAPAYGLGYIELKATAQKAGLIKGFEQNFTLSFVPDYKPLIQPTYPATNSKEIGPLDTAIFPIQITNLGNARTVVLLTVTNVPSNWNAIITDQVILEEGTGSTGTAYLVIKPPKGFGYHDDQKTITISMQPVKADDYSKKGETTYATFLVQSRGFSTPGFETISFIGALAAVLLIITCLRRRK